MELLCCDRIGIREVPGGVWGLLGQVRFVARYGIVVFAQR